MQCLITGMKPDGSDLSSILVTPHTSQPLHLRPIPSALSSPSTEQSAPADLRIEMFSRANFPFA